MSYDVMVQIDAGGEEPISIGDHNYTSNLARVWDHAGAPLREWHGRPAGKCIAPLREAAERIRVNIRQYREWEPDNGWGDCEGAARFLDAIADTCELAPLGKLWIWR